jgi:hypothetical protein
VPSIVFAVRSTVVMASGTVVSRVSERTRKQYYTLYV